MVGLNGGSETTFTITTPTRNALPLLRRCVGSVRAQGQVSREHFVVDALSEDGTSTWLAAEGVSHISEQDSGMYDAINKGFARASGDVLSWLNADEQYLPGTLSAVRRYLSQHPGVDVVFGDFIVVDATGEPLAARRALPARRLYLLSGALYTTSCTLFFRRRLFDDGLLSFNPAHRYVGDVDLVLRLLEAGATFAHLPIYMGLFTMSDSNLSSHPGAVRELREVYRHHRPALLKATPVRLALKAARWAEKLGRGCYRTASLSYEFSLDEQPALRQVSRDRVTWRWTVPVRPQP